MKARCNAFSVMCVCIRVCFNAVSHYHLSCVCMGAVGRETGFSELRPSLEPPLGKTVENVQHIPIQLTQDHCSSVPCLSSSSIGRHMQDCIRKRRETGNRGTEHLIRMCSFGNIPNEVVEKHIATMHTAIHGGAHCCTQFSPLTINM